MAGASGFTRTGRVGRSTARPGGDSSSWELDALEPDVLGALIREAVAGFVDAEAWAAAVDAEATNRDLLARISDRWDDVAAFVASDPGR